MVHCFIILDILKILHTKIDNVSILENSSEKIKFLKH